MSDIAPEKQVLSVGEISKIFLVGRATVQRWLDKGLIESYELPSGHRRVTVKALKLFASGEKGNQFFRDRIDEVL